MEFFNQAKAVRLKSHLEKYLVADDDLQNVRQSQNCISKKSRWSVEFVDRNPHVIRLKSFSTGRYLTASDDAYLLGMTGKKVLQSEPDSKSDAKIEWEPIREGYKVKLRTRGGKFLRANGATPPWRNSITHDLPYRTATQDWVFWDVEVVDISALQENEYLESGRSSFSSSSVREEEYSSPGRSPLAADSRRKEDYSSPGRSPMADSRRRPSILGEDYSSPGRSPLAPTERRLRSSISREEDLSLVRSPAMPNGASERRKLSEDASEKRWPSIASERSSQRTERQVLNEGMEFFLRAKSVRLQSHLGKYLSADDDELTVRQSRHGSSREARWVVEFVPGKPNKIRLKSCHGLYLTASDAAFLLGMTGKKVLQTLSENKKDVSTEWEPVKEGVHVKLMTSDGKLLRGNGSTPPWRNTVTHDVPHRTATQNWVLWGVEIVEIAVSDHSDTSSNRLSAAEDFSGSPDTGSPVAGSRSVNQASGMEFFKKAKSVRLKGHHDKYLSADTDEESVIQDRSGSSRSAKWTVEFVQGVDNVLRLKSCYGKYLTSSEEHFILGVTGQKVVQSVPRKLDSSIEWEPIRDGMQVKLKTRYGNFLRANGGLPPWRNSITHDIPHRHLDWILWEVDVVEIRPESPPKVSRCDSLEEDSMSSDSFNLRFPSRESSGPVEDSPRKSEGRLIYYYIADDDGNVNDVIEGASFQFKGHGLQELTQKLEEETGVENIIVCSRNLVNGKLYPLRLALPPNNATMNVVIVPSTSKVAKEFMPPPTST